MSINEADQATPAAGVRPDAAGVRPDTADVRPHAVAPLLRTLGDTDAGVCADGFCEVPRRQQEAPGQAATTGADE